MTQSSHEGAAPCLQELQTRFDSLRADISSQLAKVRRNAPQRTVEGKQRDVSLTAVTAAPRHGSAAVDHKTKRSVGSKPRTRFRAAQENRALSENQPLQRLKSERIQRSIDQEIVVEWPKRVRSAKRKQKAKNQEWTSDFAEHAAGQRTGGTAAFETEGGSRGDWLRVSMRTPGASRDPSPERSPAESPECKGKSGVQEVSSPPSVLNSGMRETTLTCIPSSHDCADTNCVETNPKARFADDISLDCIDDDIPHDTAVAPPGQTCATAHAQPGGFIQDATPRVGAPVGTSDSVPAGAQTAGSAQLPLVGSRNAQNFHSAGPVEWPSLGRSTAQHQSEAYLSHASHHHLHAVQHGPLATSATMQPSTSQTSPAPVRQGNATFTEKLTYIPGCVPAQTDSLSQHAPSTCNPRALPLLNSSSQLEPCYARARSDTGHHQYGAMMHQSRHEMPSQRHFSVEQSFRYPQQRQAYYNATFDNTESGARPSCPSLTDRTPVFDAYSQGFRFPRCEDAWAAVQANQGNRVGGAMLNTAGQSYSVHRSRLSRATSPGALLGNMHESGSESQNSSFRKRRQWFDSQEHGWQGGAVSQSHPHTGSSQQSAFGGQQPCVGVEREQEERAWNNRMAAVRARLAALAAERNGLSHGNTLAGTSATDVSHSNQSCCNNWQAGDWGNGTGPATPPRSVGRRPVGPGDAFQGQSLSEVLKSTPTLSPKPNHTPQLNAATDDVLPNEDSTPMRARRHAQNDSALASALDSFGGLSLAELMPARQGGRIRPAAGLSGRLQSQRSRPRVGSMTAADLQPQPYWGSHDSGGEAWMISAGQNGATTALTEDVGPSFSQQHRLGALALLERITAGACGQPRANLEDAQECSICLDIFKPEQGLRRYKTCGHSFHERCIVEWLARGDGRCPYCRGNP